MKKITIAIVILIIVTLATYYFVFKGNYAQAPAYTPPPTAVTNNTDTGSIADFKTKPAGATVDIKNFTFNPNILSIKTGTTVTWVNNDSAPHTITSDTGTLLKSDTIAPGQSFSFTFAKGESVDYHCSIHTTMKGKIIVQD
jgi:plastocyanin